jgi:hypothetical protein
MTTLQNKTAALAKRIVKARSNGSTPAPFHMANLYPRTTGLPMTVWVSPRGRTRHDARVKVCRTHGDNMDPSNLMNVAIRPSPQVMRGAIPPADFASVAAWTGLNQGALIGYWDGTIDTLELTARPRKVGT